MVLNENKIISGQIIHESSIDVAISHTEKGHAYEVFRFFIMECVNVISL